MDKQQKAALKLIHEYCEQYEMNPNRIITTDNNAVLLSWFGEHKYAELEIQRNGEINGWTSFEIGTPTTFAIVRHVDESFEINIVSGMRVIQEFLS